LPFDSDRKMMTTYNKTGSNITSYTKGAPDIMLARCTHYLAKDGQVKSMSTDVLKAAEKANHDFACKAIRVLAFAKKVFENVSTKESDSADEENMIFLGLIGMIDPARDEARDAIAVSRKAGIRTVMITGDFKDSAVAIAENLNMSDDIRALSGKELSEMSDEDLKEAVGVTSVFARVSPEHKVRIVEALKATGHIASMTGDGVNDAPALKSADIGVAMGITGTDVAKNSADMILLDDNFATIVKAVEQGRVIYSNIRKFVNFLLSCNIGEILIVFIISLIPNSVMPGIAAPLTAIQLLWLNLVTDSFPALALGREKGEPGIMDVPPRPKDEPILNKSMRSNIAVQALAIFAAVASSFLIAFTHPTLFATTAADTIDIARTVAFATLICAELFRAFATRSEHASVFEIGLFSNRFMNISVLVSLALTLAVIYIPGVNGIFDNIPLTATAWGIILPLAIVPFASSEIHKLIKRRMKKSK